jgi:hypothetical protein
VSSDLIIMLRDDADPGTTQPPIGEPRVEVLERSQRISGKAIAMPGCPEPGSTPVLDCC